MSVRRLQNIPGFSIDRVAAAAGNDPAVLRLENLDTDLALPPGVTAATQAALGRDDDNSYLPFTGQEALRAAVTRHVEAQTEQAYRRNSGRDSSRHQPLSLLPQTLISIFSAFCIQLAVPLLFHPSSFESEDILPKSSRIQFPGHP